jgi:hypothetical protein
VSVAFRTTLAVLGLGPALAAAQMPTAGPLKHDPKPTTAAITAQDLMTRLYIFSDDSLQGRAAGSVGHNKGADYIAGELKKLGLKPMGENGTFFQSVPLVRRAVDGASTLTVDGQTLAFGTDFLYQAINGGTTQFTNAPVVWGGLLGDTTQVLADARGKFVLLRPGPGAGNQRALMAQLAKYEGAAGVAIVLPFASIPPGQTRAATTPRITLPGAPMMPGLPGGIVQLTTTAALKLTGMPLDSMKLGMGGKVVSGDLRMKDEPAPSNNVVAMLEGTDKNLKGQIVSVGGHNDHVGIAGVAVDHDSLKAVNWALNKFTFDNGKPAAGPVRDSIVKAVVAGLKSSGRRDSIRNGADDDGSGSMAVLEIAESFAKAKQKPKRSVLFLWYTAEENGLLGSRYFTDKPTVSRDSVVANLNIDMLGRGRSDDMKQGGDSFVQLVGSRRLSTQLGDLVEAVNAKRASKLALDYSFDADGHPENIYCRSDHYNWARFGIPVTFFTTGLHGDYHQVTDEAQYIDYPHYASLTQFIAEVLGELANRKDKPVVDKPKPDPNGVCRQ